MNTALFTKTRLAPTPSGYLHLGNAVSFVFTALLARKANAKLLMRIDDLDQQRTQKQYVDDIFETLLFLGIDWDEGPRNYAEQKQTHSQLQRLPLYLAALQQLKNENKVYACACSRLQLASAQVCFCRKKKLSLNEPNLSWRLVTDDALSLVVKTMKGEVITTLLPAAMQGFVVRKKNGFPSYQLASLIDDEHFAIDAIVRGEDLWDSTLAQHYLALQLNKTFFKEVYFYHHPLLMNDNRTHKLSKSAGAYSIQQLRSDGKTKEEVLEMIERFFLTFFA